MRMHRVIYLIGVAAISSVCVFFTLTKDMPEPLSVTPQTQIDIAQSDDSSGNPDAECNVTTTSATVTTVVTTTTTAVFCARVELNTGTFEDFAAIPILTDEQAMAIIELREKIHYFSHCYELLYADGFNEKLVAELCQYVYVENQP